MTACRALCLHRERVADYRRERERQLAAAEAASLGYSTEWAEYTAAHPLVDVQGLATAHRPTCRGRGMSTAVHPAFAEKLRQVELRDSMRAHYLAPVMPVCSSPLDGHDGSPRRYLNGWLCTAHAPVQPYVAPDQTAKALREARAADNEAYRANMCDNCRRSPCLSGKGLDGCRVDTADLLELPDGTFVCVPIGAAY